MEPSHQVLTIDCEYIKPERAAAYLIVDGDEAAFVDNNTAKASAFLLHALSGCGLEPCHVKYLIITHVHLDHAGGTSSLLNACPNAQVLAHPRAVRHLIDPGRLVQSAKQVYGEDLFERLYGHIEGIPEDRVQAVEDNETRCLGKSTLTFLHTAGHARHHITIYDDASRIAFTGDTFGVTHPRLVNGEKPFLLFSTAPTEFEPDKAHESIDRILATGAEKAAVTHYGIVPDIHIAAESLHASISSMAQILNRAATQPLQGEDLKRWCEAEIWEFVLSDLRACGIEDDAWTREWLTGDVRINAAGLAYCAERLRSS